MSDLLIVTTDYQAWAAGAFAVGAGLVVIGGVVLVRNWLAGRAEQADDEIRIEAVQIIRRAIHRRYCSPRVGDPEHCYSDCTRVAGFGARELLDRGYLTTPPAVIPGRPR